MVTVEKSGFPLQIRLYFEKGIKKWLKIICARVENLLAIAVILVLEVRSLNSRTSG